MQVQFYMHQKRTTFKSILKYVDVQYPDHSVSGVVTWRVRW